MASTSPAMVYHLPGEPAVVIDGVLDPTAEAEPSGPSDPKAEREPARGNPGLGVWLEGREVRKLFGAQYYSGTVTEFDKEAGWYRVVYEDGDFEDLEWHELEEVLVPVDIGIPLKSLAQRVLRKNQKPAQKVWTTPQTEKKRGRPKGSKNKPKNIEKAAKEDQAPRAEQLPM
ncbi:hypothetical protein CRG98_017539 [Punica granatum]|uniref:PTM/DIR17-like Tudor domain-containing protein n=1 Tax=Punica granatum TaxID=22663 RepID=A0A2I0K388_PUNGR|nr:hypothetical protein CRG98_017539 [Punica granatum]